MNPNMLPVRFFFCSFKNTFFFFFYLLLQTALSADRQFEACVPHNCGTGPNISYPFWIDTQESYCGYPDYNISCFNQWPFIKKLGYDYYIKDIFYGNQSLLISNHQFSNPSCPFPLQDLPQDLGPYKVNYSYNLKLNFYFNCSGPFPDSGTSHNISCLPNNSTHYSFIYFGPPISDYLNCESHIIKPVVNEEEFVKEKLDDENYHEVLQMGFLLEWFTSDNSCSDCEFSGGHCGYNRSISDFLCFCPDRPYPRTCNDSGLGNWGENDAKGKPSKKKLIAIATATGVGGSLLLVAFFFIIYYCRKRFHSSSSTLLSRTTYSDSSSKNYLENSGIIFQTHVFTYNELEEATNNFDPSKELGDGGFGTVYHGKLRDGRFVAVKRLYENNCKRAEQFINEVEILSGLRHQHLVSLYGCTSRHSRELLLVYEFIPNGTVADHIHGRRANTNTLPWSIRLRIAIETADAIAYLHAVTPQIIHRDVKTNNILLDNNFEVKVADFGLSRLFPTDVTHVSTAPQGTPGYVDPDYHQCYQLTEKSDVYSFGVVLIELISSKPAVDIKRDRREINLASMALHKIQNHALHELVDPCLGFDSDVVVRKMITLVAELAFRCLQMDKDLRPSMKEVLEVLRGIEGERYEVEKTNGVESDDIVLLNISSSPVSVADKWVSRSTTPSNSG